MSSKIFNNTKINVEFDEDYQSRININSGENISSLFAKIRRFILDLKSVAFSGSYNDLSDTPDVVAKEYVDPIKSQAALNRTTLGTQCKNLLKNTSGSKSLSGVDLTVNSGGSVTASRNTSSTDNVYYIIRKTKLPKGKYIFTGDNDALQSGEPHLGIYKYSSDGTYLGYQLPNVPFTVNDETVSYQFTIIYPSSYSEPVTFYPMLRYADILDDTYEPYIEDINTRLNNLLARIEILEGSSS